MAWSGLSVIYIRLQNPMKIVFVTIAVESLTIEFLSSFLKKHCHQVEIVFDPALFATEAVVSKKLAKIIDITKEIVYQINEMQPDLIGFSVFTLNYQRSLKIAKLIKKSNPKIPIVFGGIHPTCVPERVIKEKVVDIVCIGEGEYPLLELLDSFKNNKKNFKIKNLWFKEGKRIIKNPLRPLITNLNKLPFPDKELFYKIYPGFAKDYYTTSSRGCPFSCTFCANNALKRVYRHLGQPIRQRSPENIIEELSLAKKKYPIKQITFVDDVFVQNVSWLKTFSQLYRQKIKLPYAMLTHPSLVTKQIALLLKKSGCYHLDFGIQSASEKTRKEILKRFESNETILKASQFCHQAGLDFSIDHIFNIPSEGPPQYLEALKFYNRLRPSVINSYWLQYFPKTEIVKIAIKKGILKKSIIPKIEKGLTGSSLVVGIGGKDSINPNLAYTNYQLLFMLTPILPKKLMDKIIKKNLLLAFRPPMIFNIILKFFINLKIKRGDIYLGIIKSTFFFMQQNLKLKWRYRRS